MSQYPHDKKQSEEGRPDPEELLRRYSLRDNDLEAPLTTTPVAGTQPSQQTGGYPHRRGRLRVYLGSVAASGKTYAMLNEGHRRESRGTEVVPGSQHAKRYQDVEEIMDAGIDVVTTLNIQHLESLNDLVASITGVRVRETLPDWILDQAEEVELIDISPYALRQRMSHGNIYPPERIDAALNNFFREGNLTALRELALRRLEEHALLAEDLGAEVIRTKSGDIAKTLVEIAHERQVTQLVLGQPARSHWEELLRGCIINRLLRLSTDVDIHLVPRSAEE
jgi:two-component system, OmpR family, sensor histidine kinase KdpD